MYSRHAGYDNCKNVFIFYVVLIHLCNFNLIKWSETDTPWSPAIHNIFEGYNLWHEKLSVPGFVFMSGFFGKGFLPESLDERLDKRWEKTISVLLIGSALVQICDFAVGMFMSKIILGSWDEVPTWFPLWEKLETWYLIALFLWRMATPLIGRLRHPLVTSVLVAFICLHVQFEGPMDMRYVYQESRELRQHFQVLADFSIPLSLSKTECAYCTFFLTMLLVYILKKSTLTQLIDLDCTALLVLG